MGYLGEGGEGVTVVSTGWRESERVQCWGGQSYEGAFGRGV